MNILDICIIILVLAGGFLGYKKGAIKGLIQTVGLIAIAIVAYQFKGMLGDLLVRFMPFFNLGGQGIYALNVLMYHGIAFIVIFILLYCLLNILLNLSGFVDFLIKQSVIYEEASKISGIVIGAIESIVFIFVLLVGILHIGPLQHNVTESAIARKIVYGTPIINVVFAQSTVGARNIYLHNKEYVVPENVTEQELRDIQLEANLSVIRELIGYQISSANAIQKAIDDGRMRIDRNTIVASS